MSGHQSDLSAGLSSHVRCFLISPAGFSAAEAALLACVLGAACIITGTKLSQGAATAASNVDGEIATGAPEQSTSARPPLAWQIPAGSIPQTNGIAPVRGTIRKPGDIQPAGTVQEPRGPWTDPATLPPIQTVKAIEKPGVFRTDLAPIRKDLAPVRENLGPIERPGSIARTVAFQKPDYQALLPPTAAAATVVPTPTPPVTQADLERVLDSVNDFWRQQYLEHGQLYTGPRAILLDPNVSGCAYFPGSRNIRCNPSFVAYARRQWGDFAIATIIAHEVGHHLQNLQGERVLFTKDSELEADYYAGRYARYAQDHGLLPPGGLGQAAFAYYAAQDHLPDFHFQRHGSLEDRYSAFLRGYTGQSRPPRQI